MMAIPLYLLFSSRLVAEEWIGLEAQQPAMIGFDLGRNEVEDLSSALFLSLPLGDSAGYYGYYSNTSLSQEDQEFDSLSLATTIWFQLTDLVEGELFYFFEGNEGELEKETLGIGLSLNQGNWNFRVQLDTGELLIFTRDDVSDFLSTMIPDRFDTDIAAFELALGMQVDAWYWQASYRRYDYERDLSGLDRSSFAQFIVSSAALAQSTLLISQDASLLVGRADYSNDYSVLISQNRSAIDRSYDETLMLSWQHWPSRSLGYMLSASMPLPVDSVGLTLGLRWVI